MGTHKKVRTWNYRILLLRLRIYEFIFYFLSRKYQEYLKSHNREALQKIDSSIDNVVALLRCAYSSLVLNDSSASVNHDVVTTVLRNVRESLINYTDVFRNRALRNLTLGTYPFHTTSILIFLID